MKKKSKESKIAIAIRTHKYTENEKYIYNYASSYFGAENTFFLCNNLEKNVKIPNNFNTVYWNPDILRKLNLFVHPTYGRLCGDYVYYMFDNAIKGYDYLWVLEDDIYFCNKEPKKFFSNFIECDHDFLCYGYGPAHKNLSYYSTSRFVKGTPMSCFFPITRIKINKIEMLFNERKIVSQPFISGVNKPSDFPNDEIFTATASNRLGLKCGALQQLCDFDFRLYDSARKFTSSYNKVKEMNGNFILHFVLNDDDYINKQIISLNNHLNNPNFVLNELIRDIFRGAGEGVYKERVKKEITKVLEIYFKKIK